MAPPHCLLRERHYIPNKPSRTGRDTYHFERPTDNPLLRTSRHQLEIHCPTGCLVGRMVGANGRHNFTLHKKSLGEQTSRRRETEYNSGKHQAAIYSRPLTQDDGPETLTPTHFLHGGPINTIPTKSEPTMTKSLTKEFRLQQQLVEDFWERWTKHNILELRSYHQVRQPCGRKARFRVGDVVVLQGEVRPRDMWKRGQIED